MALYLKENLTFDRAGIIVETVDEGGNKTLKMEGIFIEGGVKNANERVYPVHEIEKAVGTINKQINEGYSVLGEVDHPDDLKINLDRVSHMIEKMWMDGPTGRGKLKVLPTPMGKLVEAMITSGVKLGVSSRGSGNVNEGSGHVSEFEIITVDIVAQPSAPHAYPKAIYEGLMNMRGGMQVFETAREAAQDQKVQKYLEEGIKRLIKDLKLQEKYPMLDAIKPLLDNGIINEETKTAIAEAWESRIVEAKEQVRAELREEFAQRYQHDKAVMVEALDKMVTESLTAELSEFADEKRQLAEDRVAFKQQMVESAGKFNDFMVTKLAEEIKELRQDRKTYESAIAKLEQFTIHALAEEIKEFEQDKQAVVETKVRLVTEGKAKLAELQKKFVEQSAAAVKEAVTSSLESELTQLKEDIQVARENMFGRRLYEAFASEFAVTHLNENKQIRELQSTVDMVTEKLSEAVQAIENKKALVESKEKEIRIIKETAERKERVAEMLKPLNKEKAAIMRDLLESVQTDKLQSAYEKYLPAVLNNTPVAKPATEKVALTESRVVEVTGDKTAKTAVDSQQAKDVMSNVFEMKRLAGLN